MSGPAYLDIPVYHGDTLTRAILAGAFALALLHACVPRQPPGGDLWRVVPQRDNR